MEAEAAPIRRALGCDGDGAVLHPAFPARVWCGERACVAVNGTDPRFGVDSIATQPAVTTTLHAIERCSPGIVVSAGTCGGFEARGAAVGTVYLADACGFHDRRIAIPGFDRYGEGDYPVADLSTLAAELGHATGRISSGNALDAPDVDLARIAEAAAVAKDMEAAAVAWVCERTGVSFTAVKAVTDLVDHPEATEAQFMRNLATATDALARAVAEVVDALATTGR